MAPKLIIDRRRLILRAGAGAAAALVAGCDRLSQNPWAEGVLGSAEWLNGWLQRRLAGPHSLAREYAEADISRYFKANGSINPSDPAYRALAAEGFVGWRLKVHGLVDRPLALSLADLAGLPARTQITRHDCVEGWSCIGKWTGVPLAAVLAMAGIRPQARYIVFHCADSLEAGGERYYESIDMEDAAHPQTILAYAMNDRALPIRHGAPLRLRVERQLGYKMAKYVMAVEAVDSFARRGGGRGGYWEDRGYEWYAGI